ncbi:hypothetical protein K458DRAFT_386297 [Lentithecium fluviatile CBS 122367]|uniref:Uncharacterized protein n=1 Tax=Lentithecium fluviatile CBS 122367 TaxID=1168545 RepID=A0A6G1JAC5_9PLEO|nr:hypothetical protein K458DRAFT_386297 [Lentithecium fluviatile CBS 122367]
MSHKLVACFFSAPTHSNGSGNHLRHLDLCNLQQWSETDPPLPSFPHLRDLAIYRKHRKDIKFVPNSGFMVGVPDPLIGRYTALTSLRISTAGEDKEDGQDPRDDLMYVFWARFLKSVWPTLEHFFFVQGGNNGLWTAFFVEYILPILLEGPWPRIKRMHLRGIGSSTNTYERADPSTEEEVEGPDTEIHVKLSEECVR